MAPSERPDHVTLSKRFKKLKLPKYDPFGLRLHRALSWYKKACEESDEHAKYVFLWIAFNAAYGIEDDAYGIDGEEDQTRGSRSEYHAIADYLGKITDVDGRRIWMATGGLKPWIEDLVSNRFVFYRFWRSLRSEDDTDARDQYDRHVKWVGEWADAANTETRDETQLETLLDRVFSRLRVLRNQLLHGAVTPVGRGNMLSRRQVQSGVRILEGLLPIFLDIMMDDPHGDWGSVPYPVRDDVKQRWSPAPRGGK